MIVVLNAHRLAFAHEQHRVGLQKAITIEEKSSFEKINEMYQAEVKPIFESKCFDCHTNQIQLPWYSQIPAVRQLIQNDLDKAKEHLNMESRFPFTSHATPSEDLQAISKAVTENEMPPFRYRFMHLNKSLTSAEKEKIKRWVQYGLDLLAQKTTVTKEKE